VSRILIVGGYGAFGARIAERLARQPGYEIIVAGRNQEAAARIARELGLKAKARVLPAQLNALSAGPEEIAALAPAVTINASGPFQEQGYALARACIAVRSHYVDIADARAFVTGIGALDGAARAANVSVISGASSVPGLSSAVVQAYAGEFSQLDDIEIGISPGNRFDPGEATTASILSQAGKPHRCLSEGRAVTAYGWQGLTRHSFPEIGVRLMCDVDVPDLDLIPRYYPQLKSLRFVAGLEVKPFHLGVWGLSRLARAGLVRDLSPLAAPLLALKRAFHFLGSDCGGMFVTLRGLAGGERREVQWHLIARSGHGPYVPGIAAAVLAKRLIAGTGPPPGAGPCFALFPLADFEAEVADLDISCTAARI
jgi:saccharopine dehydrogenase-like NADP-dependent oxidoreductase